MATKTRQLADFLVAGGVSDAEIQSVPHIRPGILQPAIAGKLLDGTTSHSGAYGTAQSDGHSYYYTDIKGSKPIKDPRIGAHFGSQRHKFKSLQSLEQETAINGKNVYSIDGREWARACGGNFDITYNVRGTCILMAKTTTDTNFIEVVGYWNNINIDRYTDTDNRYLRVSLNGGTVQETDYNPLVGSPLYGRYVDSGSIRQVTFNSTPTLGINTIKIFNKVNDEYNIHSIELIAQDTSSTANRSKIQIPSQNVVSYGKKFTVSGTPHYDPFNGFTNGTTLHSANVDTATSLGLGTGTTYGAPWAISSSNHIRPFNGGRVVKWVASDGTIKTSVTMMPRNAQNIGTDVSNEITTASATNSHTLNFSDDAVENSLSEVAKSFHWREFGNGAANGGTGATYADFSRLQNPEDDVAYVMDDGLTSMSGNDNSAHTNYIDWYTGGGDTVFITFIGTGISFEADPKAIHAGITNGVYAQNLPYGTHILKLQRSSPYDVWVDGVQLSSAATSSSDHIGSKFITFHQPKMPPIPEDACIIADYMLMADFVAQTSESVENISKGVRLTAPSRDMFYSRSAGSFVSNPFAPELEASQFHINCWQGNASGTETRILPVFGDSFCMTFSTNSDTNTTAMPLTAGSAGTTALDNWTLTSGGSSVTSLSAAGSLVCAASSAKGFVCAKAGASVELGIQQLKSVGTIASGGYHYQRTYGVHTPIHTSHHYQPFETPYLYELIGGDRNMEQTNLVVTPDGKTWDQVTRDTSYISNLCVVTTTNEEDANHDEMLKYWDLWRGTHNVVVKSVIKNFAISYDRLICLVDGWYHFRLELFSNSDISSSDWARVMINNERLTQSYQHDTSELKVVYCSASGFIKRGDNITIRGAARGGDEETSRFEITKMEK